LYRIKFYGIAWYCMVLHCTIVGFGARAVSRKTPTYFMQPLVDCGGRKNNLLSVGAMPMMSEWA
jgi:hypothetical protein